MPVKTVQKYANGDEYEGEAIDGKRSGAGMYVAESGETFAGQWKQGLMHGMGELDCDAGRYEGEWRNGMKHGDGTFEWPNGDSFQGIWSKDNMYEGTMKWSNGAVYTGQWGEGGVRSGYGEFSVDDITYEGEWEDDKYNGYGKLTEPLGVYQGEWKDGKKQGSAVFTRKDGNHRFDGNYEDDKKTTGHIFIHEGDEVVVVYKVKFGDDGCTLEEHEELPNKDDVQCAEPRTLEPPPKRERPATPPPPVEPSASVDEQEEGGEDGAEAEDEDRLIIPYEELKMPSKWGRDQIDVLNRENYLSDVEFKDLLGCTRAEWAKVPGWKKQTKKKQLKLF
eukprot:TRINITY_DN74797_c0_g1_i1.p2 TRINITY_DN74797_c0_g1~~TRINITY_DN74797_c0_g1_i1.p2  ORF type:complete len:334 (+),score=69.86 TRINITY_DN74797_c0_g1_i1:34-1035(+)